MNTMRTVADFATPTDAERTVGALVEAGVDPQRIAVMASPLDTVPEDAATGPKPAQVDAVRLAVTAPHDDLELVEDILRDAGKIDLQASETPGLGWSGDPEGATLDKSRTPAIGWAGKVSRSS